MNHYRCATGCDPAAHLRFRLLPLVVAGALLPLPGFSQELSDNPGTAELDEVIVTARRVEENVLDVPMSIQVLTGSQLDVTDNTHLFDLQYSVPGLVVNNLGLNGAGFSLRAISNQGGSRAVAAYLNGVYLGRSNLAIARMFDLQRIEILKGPQGTLYGRNATGGAINFITRPPEDEFSADVEAARGSFDTTRVQGHVNVPFDASALRVAYIVSEGDGYIRNSVDDRRFAQQDFLGLRASWRAAPSDRLQVSVMLQHVEDDGGIGELWAPRPDYLADPSDIRLATVTLADPFLATEVDNADLNVEYDLGFATLNSITGFAGYKVRDLDDCAGLPILSGCVRSAMPARFRQASQELRLVSRADRPVTWLVGAHAYEDHKEEYYYQLTPVIDPNPTSDNFSTNRARVLAAFGQAGWHLSDRWRITGGLRLNRETLRASTIGTGTEDSPTGITSERTSTNDSWRVDLEYSVNEGMLLYAGVSTGFKSGGVTFLEGGVVDTYDPEHLTAIEAGIKSRRPDGRLTLSAAVFHYDFRDMQVATSTITDDGLIFETDNAARAEVQGLDIESGWQAADWLTVSAGVVWLPKREFVAYRNDRTGDTLSGNKLIRSPEWSATAAVGVEQAISGHGRLVARLEYNYRSEFFYTTDNNPRFSQDGFGLLNLFLRYEHAGDRWYAFASGRNLGNEDYFNQVFLQSSPGYPDTWEIGFGYRF